LMQRTRQGWATQSDLPAAIKLIER
jgi:hypothetical protein